MSYQCGIGPSMRALGIQPRDPHIVCDGCGATRVITSSHVPPAWFLDGKPPPKWRLLRKHDGSNRWDLCPTCWQAPTPDRGTP